MIVLFADKAWLKLSNWTGPLSDIAIDVDAASE